jgi:Ohr subfamily peroxiredoxin
MPSLQNILYTGEATTIGGRTGTAKSSDGALDVTLSRPKALGGDGGAGTNPEQLFAAGYAACFTGALGVAAQKAGETLPEDIKITGKVGIGPIEGGFGLRVALDIAIPGMDTATAEKLVELAHQICPYSNATRGNIDVALHVVAA